MVSQTKLFQKRKQTGEKTDKSRHWTVIPVHSIASGEIVFSGGRKERRRGIDVIIKQLARYMIDFSVGVTTVSTYEIKKLDSDYFMDE